MSDDTAIAPSTDSHQSDSLWLATSESTTYPALDGDLSVDTAIIGGGITGLTTAVNLHEAGQTVAVIEADRIVRGVTGYTTAKITSQHGLCYQYLVDEFGAAKANQYAMANEAAIDEIESRVEDRGIDCDFERRPAYTYTENQDEVAQLRAEVDAADDLGLPASYTATTELPFDVAGAVKFDEQAQFHPRRYLLAIAEAIQTDGSYVFEQTKATAVDDGSPCQVETARGDIHADNVVIASHFPVADPAGYFARMHPKQAYLLAVRTAERPPDGMYYSTDDPPVTLRGHPADGEDLLIVGGQGHQTGDNTPPMSERYRRCEAFARDQFTVESIEYRWSTHDYYPVDRVPFVGALGPGIQHVFVGTGFKGWGMSGGTAAGMILADLIRDGANPWAAVFDPQRVTPKASAKKFISENTEVAGHFVCDRVQSLFSRGAQPVAGEATIVRQNGRPVGVYRDQDGKLHAVSAVCPHMKCLVQWNDAELTWDCPCHGSRFTYDGDVISGPALDDLETF